MPLDFVSSHFDGDVVVVASKVFRDHRGFFLESFREDNFRELGLPTQFVQDNHSRSTKGVVRGLHLQWSPPMGKLMRVTRGAAFVVAVDVRLESPSLGRWFAVELTEDDPRQIWAPYGFARGFCALTDDCEVQYKCTGVYNPMAESAIRFDDPEIAIDWPLQNLVVSDKDRSAPTLREWIESPLACNVRYQPEFSGGVR